VTALASRATPHITLSPSTTVAAAHLPHPTARAPHTPCLLRPRVCCAHASVAPPPKPCAQDSWRIAWLKPPEQGGLSCKMCLSLWVAGQSAHLGWQCLYGCTTHRACTTQGCTTPPRHATPPPNTHTRTSNPHPNHNCRWAFGLRRCSTPPTPRPMAPTPISSSVPATTSSTSPLPWSSSRRSPLPERFWSTG
jgi:hypothetical protein